MGKILITTFQTWLTHHTSNSADDLVGLVADRLPWHCQVLRHLPVDFEAAPRLVLARIAELQPEIVVCCGMAESRSRLSIESNGRWQSDLRFTTVDLAALCRETQDTTISHDAGGFVCNYLYYQVLRQWQAAAAGRQAIFVHVPLLTETNRATMVEDFCAILSAIDAYNP
jgi:pyroglutamyl-peptidase